MPEIQSGMEKIINSAPLNKSERAAIIELWQESGKNKTVFCRELGLKYHAFISWTNPKKKKSKPRGGITQGSFVPVRIKDDPGVVFAEISFQNGTVLLIRQSVAAEYLRKILG